MSKFINLFTEITQNDEVFSKLYKSFKIKTEFHKDVGWARVSFQTDRHLFLQHHERLEEIIRNNGLFFDVDFSWLWQDIPSLPVKGEVFNVHQSTRTYVYFITAGDNTHYYNHEKMIGQISLTNDPLYDYRPRDYVESYLKYFEKEKLPFGWGGNSNSKGFVFHCHTKVKAEKLNVVLAEVFDRRLTWKVDSRSPRDKVYSCLVLMDDVEYSEELVSLKQLFKSVTPVKKREKKVVSAVVVERQYSIEEMFERIKQGEMTVEEFTKAMGEA